MAARKFLLLLSLLILEKGYTFLIPPMPRGSYLLLPQKHSVCALPPFVLSSPQTCLFEKRINDRRRKELGIGDDEDEYDLGVALNNNTDPFITKVRHAHNPNFTSSLRSSLSLTLFITGNCWKSNRHYPRFANRGCHHALAGRH